MSSLRRRLTLAFAGELLVFAVVVGFVVHLVARDALVEQFDQGLAARAAGLAALLELDGPLIEFDDALVTLPGYAAGGREEAFQIWSPEGLPLARSASLPDLDLPARGTEGAPETWDLDLPRGRPGRALALVAPIAPDEDLPEVALADMPRVTVVVARQRRDLDVALMGLGAGLAGAFAATLVLGALAMRRSVTRGLAPVQALGRRVEAIDADSLGNRVGADDLPDELAPLAAKLDELLDRLQDGFERQRRMTAAMAHELRTPVAELRGASDVARRWPDDPDLAREVLDTADEVATRMGAALEAVMHMARVEAGLESVTREPVALAALVERLWQPLAEGAAARDLSLELALDGELVVESDPALLELVLRNLLDNAASFSDPGTVRVDGDPGAGLVVAVSNPAAGLTEADLAHLSEPFWRRDAARTGGEHSGLGLSLVRSLAGALGLRLELSLADGRLVAALRRPAGGA